MEGSLFDNVFITIDVTFDKSVQGLIFNTFREIVNTFIYRFLEIFGIRNESHLVFPIEVIWSRAGPIKPQKFYRSY